MNYFRRIHWTLPCCTQHRKCLGTDHIEMLNLSNWGVHSSFCTNLRLGPHRWCLKETQEWETDLINHYSKQMAIRVETRRLIILAWAFFHFVPDPIRDGRASCPDIHRLEIWMAIQDYKCIILLTIITITCFGFLFYPFCAFVRVFSCV